MHRDGLSKQARSRPLQQLGRDVGGRRGGGVRYSEATGQRHGRRSVGDGRLSALALLIVLVFATLVLVIVPRATGSRSYTVLTDSMAPAYPAGTLLVVKPAAFSQLKYGDIVTFQLKPGQPEVKTRRIVGFGATDTGERTLITKGDNNDTVPVRSVQIRGKLLYALPLVGYLASTLDKRIPISGWRWRLSA